MPRDALSLAVLIGREVEVFRLGQGFLQQSYLGLLVVRHDVQGLEPVVHVHAQSGPSLLLLRSGDLGSVAREVPDVADGGLHPKVLTEVLLDGTCLGRGLDDDEMLGHAAS